LSPPDTETDERLLIEAAQADPGRFAELYERHFDRVYAYVARRTRDRAVAEDVTSEVFHQALRNLPRFEWRGAPFAAWLFTIASNALADRAKRASREVLVAEPKDRADELGQAEDEGQARLFQIVRNLPEDQKKVVVLRFSEQKSIKEIAHELGRSEGAVKQLQFRALESLRARMSKADA
jgi:RNA polymerase sigma-70 factor (ECF subfamily)